MNPLSHYTGLAACASSPAYRARRIIADGMRYYQADPVMLAGYYEGCIKTLCQELALLAGYGHKPQAGCLHAHLTLGDAEVVVEYEYESGSPGRYSGPPEDCYPDDPETITPLQVLINGVWIDTDEFPIATQERWIEEISEQQMAASQAAIEDAAESRWQAQQERELERGYP